MHTAGHLTGTYTICIKPRVTSEDYRSALAAAVKEYEALGDQRREIDVRLAHLAQTIGTLSRLLGLTPTVPLSITDAVRLAMRAGVPMTPPEVRERLLAIGVDLSIYANELAVIHTVLKRLNESGELRIIPKAAGKTAYLWTRPPRAAALGPEIAEFMRGLPPGRDAAGSAQARKPKRKK